MEKEGLLPTSMFAALSPDKLTPGKVTTEKSYIWQMYPKIYISTSVSVGLIK